MAHKTTKAHAAETDSSEDEPEDSEEEPMRPAPRPISVPAKASCLTFVFLVLAVIITLILFLLNKQLMNLDWWWFPAVAALVVIIPIVVYRAVTLWMFDESARYPDIAYAWNAGEKQHAPPILSRGRPGRAECTSPELP